MVQGERLESRPVPGKLQPGEDEGPDQAGRWVNSNDLMAGDVLKTVSGEHCVIEQIEQRYEASFRVVNLTVETDPNFAVGNSGILVHNVTDCELFQIDVPIPVRATPAQYGLRTVSQDQNVLNIWNDSLRWATNGNNAYTKYLDNPTLATANTAWQETVSPQFLKRMRKAGYDISETHHWNWPRSMYPEHVFDPRHLVPVPRSRPGLHWDIHRDLTSHPNPNPNLFPPWDAVGSPIRPEHIIDFPNIASPIIAK